MPAERQNCSGIIQKLDARGGSCGDAGIYL